MNTSPQLCVFSLSDYKTGQLGFTDAQRDGAIEIIDIDGCDSYSGMYSIQNAVFTTAKKLGYEVELGIFVGNVFFSISEMDAVANQGDNHSWDSFKEVFEILSIKRQKEEEKKGDTVFLHSNTDSQHPAPYFGLFSRKELRELHEKYASAINWQLMPRVMSIEVEYDITNAFSKSNTELVIDDNPRLGEWLLKPISITQSSVLICYAHENDASEMHFVFDMNLSANAN